MTFRAFSFATWATRDDAAPKSPSAASSRWWETILKDMRKLESDVAALGDLGAASSRVAQVAKENARKVIQELRSCLSTWREKADAFIEQATKSPVLSMQQQHIVVKDYQQMFDSGA